MKQFLKKTISWFAILLLLVGCLSPLLSSAEPVAEPPNEQVEPAVAPPAIEAPATEVLATKIPATEASATTAPATEAPATQVPATVAPSTEAPVTEFPTAEALATQVPATEVPTTESPAPSEAPTAPQETPSPLPGTSADNCLSLSIGRRVEGQLTEEQSVVYYQLDALSRNQDVILTTSGIAVDVTAVRTDTGASHALSPQMQDGSCLPLNVSLTLKAGLTYRFEVSATESGRLGGFSLALNVPTKPAASAEPTESEEPAESEEPTEPAEPTPEGAVNSIAPEATPLLNGKGVVIEKASSTYTCYEIVSLQSAHNYANNRSDTWIYSAPGASKMYVTFSSNTFVENGWDYITILDGSNKVIGKYTGSELAGVTVTVNSSTLKILLETDSSLTCYGFAVVNISTNLHFPLYTSFLTQVPDIPTGTNIGAYIRQESGWTMQYTIFKLVNGNGEQIASQTAASTYFNVTVQQPGEYCLVATSYDGVNFATCYSNTFVVTRPAPCAITVQMSAGTVKSGQPITAVTTQQSGAPISFYRYTFIDSTGATRASYDTTSAACTYTAPPDPCYLFVQVLAYDGSTWASANSGWFSVTAPSPLQATISAQESAPLVGKAMTFTSSYTDGYDVTFNRYTIRTLEGVMLFTTDTAARSVTYTPTVAGLCSIELLAYDGHSWAQAVCWFSVTIPQPLQASVSTQESQPTVGKSMVFTASYMGGYGAYFNRYTIRTLNGDLLFTTDTASTSLTYVPKTAGLCSIELLAYDGHSWAQGIRWFSVSQSTAVHRALIIGQGYANSPLPTLNGALADANGMRSMLQAQTPTYIVTKKNDLTASSILSSITSTFSGATENDVSMFYYSGHGASDTGDLIGTDARGISPTQLRNQLDTIPGTKIVIIDACFSGNFVGKNARAASSEHSDFVVNFMAGFAGGLRSNLAAAGYYVITAASSTQTSAEGTITDGSASGRVGFFTYGLTKGCGFDNVKKAVCPKHADANSDGVLTLNEVYTYARDVASSLNSTQTAQVSPSNSSYPLFY